MTNSPNDRNNYDSTPDTVAIVSDGLPQDYLPEFPWPWMLSTGDEELPVRLCAGDDWRHVAFVVTWSKVDPMIKVTRTLEDQVWAERFESTRRPATRAAVKGVKGGKWVPLVDTEPAPALVTALTAFAWTWSADDIRRFAHALAEASRDRAEGEAAAMLRSAHEQNRVVDTWSRRTRALDIADPDARAAALALVDTWTGSANDLENLAAEIAAPVIIPPDAPPPAL